MKLIFLDIDGVLLPLPYGEDVRSSSAAKELRIRIEANPDTAGHLCRIARLGNAKVVVSSTWRKMMGLVELRWAFKNIIGIDGVTGCDWNGRGSEIHHLLEKISVEKFVILDDDTLDMGDLMPCVVKTDSRVGLTAKDAEAAIKILS